MIGEYRQRAKGGCTHLPPFGPRSVVSTTSFKLTNSAMFILHVYGNVSLAGSKLTTHTLLNYKLITYPSLPTLSLLSTFSSDMNCNQNLLHWNRKNTYLPAAVRNWDMPSQYTVFPEPGGPITNWPKGIKYLYSFYVFGENAGVVLFFAFLGQYLAKKTQDSF